MVLPRDSLAGPNIPAARSLMGNSVGSEVGWEGVIKRERPRNSSEAIPWDRKLTTSDDLRCLGRSGAINIPTRREGIPL